MRRNQAFHVLLPLFCFAVSFSALAADIASQVSIQTGGERTTLDRATGDLVSTVSSLAANHSGSSMHPPLHLAVEVVSGRPEKVAMPGALGGPGHPLYGTHYYDLEPKFPASRFSSGGYVAQEMVFRRNKHVRFRYGIGPHGEPYQEQPPEILLDPLEYDLNEGETIWLGMSASDPNGDFVTISCASLPEGAEFASTNGAPASGAFVFAPTNGQAGIYFVTFEARDPGGLKDVKTAMITVRTVNHRPIIEAPAAVALDEGAMTAIPVSSGDPDGDPLTVTVAPLPENAVFIEVTDSITFAPDYDQAGVYSITCTADDGLLSSSVVVQVTVNDVTATGESNQLAFAVDPVESPTLRGSVRVTGWVNAATNPPPARLLTTSLITAMNPVDAEQGEALDVILTGKGAEPFATHFEQGVSLGDFGPGISVVSLTVSSPTQATAHIEVDTDATPGRRGIEVITAGETAVAIPAFVVTEGENTVTGRLVDAQTGAPVSGATVFVEGTQLTTKTLADGTFVLTGVPPGGVVIGFSAADHEMIRLPLDVADGASSYGVGDVGVEPTILPVDTSVPYSLGGVLRRLRVEYGDEQTVEELEDLVLDSMILVGGKTIGIRSEDGVELNPKASSNAPIVFKEDILESTAIRLKTGAVRTLGEVLFAFTQLWGFEGGRTPRFTAWLEVLQRKVDEAWANPNDPSSSHMIFFFNEGRQLTPDPPRLHPDTPLNALQTTLLNQFLLLAAVDLADLTDVMDTYNQLLLDYDIDEEPADTQSGSGGGGGGSRGYGEDARVLWTNIITGVCEAGSNPANWTKLAHANFNQHAEEAMKMFGGGGYFLGNPNPRIQAVKNMSSFMNLNGLTMGASKLQLARGYEAHANELMDAAKQAQNEATKLKIQGYLVKTMGSTVMSLLRGQAEDAIRWVTLVILNEMTQQSVKLLKPAPPMIEEVTVEVDTLRSNKLVTLIEFERSASDPGDDLLPPEFYYTLWRSAGGETIPLFYGAIGQLTGPTKSSNGYLYHVDPDPPSGSVSYFLTCRRIRMRTVPFREWSDPEFFFEHWVLGAGWSPGAFGYKLAKDLSNTALDMYKFSAIQDSDIGNREVVYVPRPDEKPAPPVNLATGPRGETYVSIPLVGSIFTYDNGQFHFVTESGFKDPYQVGLACDSRGYLYADNSASDLRFGGRIFRWDPVYRRREYFGSVNYYSKLVQFAHACRVTTMLAGWSLGEKLFLIDQAGPSVRYLNIPSSTSDWTIQHYEHNVSQALVSSPNVQLRGNSFLALDRNGHLHVSHDDDITEALPGWDTSVFGNHKPFTQITGIEFDRYDNLYLLDNGWMGVEGGLVMLPESKRSSSFYDELASDPAIQSLFTLTRGVDAAGELRITDEGRALVWFDRLGMRYRVFGISGRILDERTLQPLRAATVRHDKYRVVTDEYGVFHFPGLLTEVYSGWLSFSVSYRNQTQAYRVTLKEEGETVLDPILFSILDPSVSVPTSTNAPPIVNTPINPTDPPPTEITYPVPTNGIPGIVSTGMTTTLDIEIARPGDGDMINVSTVEVVGAVSDASVPQITLTVNGTDTAVPVVGGVFVKVVSIEDGLNRIVASGQTFGPGGNPVYGSSPNVDVFKGPAPPTLKTLGGVIQDDQYRFPIPGLQITHPPTGLSDFTDGLGVWQIRRVPVQEDGTVIIVLE